MIYVNIFAYYSLKFVIYIRKKKTLFLVTFYILPFPLLALNLVDIK